MKKITFQSPKLNQKKGLSDEENNFTPKNWTSKKKMTYLQLSLSWSIPGQMVTKRSFTAGRSRTFTACLPSIYGLPLSLLLSLALSHRHTHTLTHITHTQIWQPILTWQPVHQSYKPFPVPSFTISRHLVRNSFHSVSLANSTEGCPWWILSKAVRLMGFWAILSN